MLSNLEKAFLIYENPLEKFAKEKRIEIERFYHDSPVWLIGKDQGAEDFDIIFSQIALQYSEIQNKFYLLVNAWMDSKYHTINGEVHERRLLGKDKQRLVTSWLDTDKVDIYNLLETAFLRANSFQSRDLTQYSAYIVNSKGIIKPYNNPSETNLFSL